jgi:hypothetical protein
MTDSTWIHLVGRGNSFRLSYPPHWNREDDEDGTITVSPEYGRVAVTVSVARHRDRSVRADACDQLQRFLKNLDASSNVFKANSKTYASVECVDAEGWNWDIVAIARANAITMISLNGRVETEEDRQAWSEGEKILKSAS